MSARKATKLDRAWSRLLRKWYPDCITTPKPKRKGMSKRKEKSNERAQEVCRELRHQIGDNRWDGGRLSKLLLRWMRVTGKEKYERPTK